MADRVAIIGGSTVGRDHFHFSVDAGGAHGAGTFWPALVSLDTACKWIYRVRRWSVAFSVSATFHQFGIDTDASFSGSFDFGFSVASYDPDTGDPIYSRAAPDMRESDLVLLSGGGLLWDVGNDQAGFDSDPDFWFPFHVKNFASANAGVSKGTGLSFTPEGTQWQSGLYPLIGFRVESRDFSLYTNIASAGRVNVGNFSFDGVIVPLWGLNYYAAGTDSTTFLNAASCTVTPLSFWPYATKAGLPVYDTSTGAQLRDPFS